MSRSNCFQQANSEPPRLVLVMIIWYLWDQSAILNGHFKAPLKYRLVAKVISAHTGDLDLPRITQLDNGSLCHHMGLFIIMLCKCLCNVSLS